MDNDELLSEFDKLYRELARLWHPDGKPADQQEKFTRYMQWLNAYYHDTRDRFIRWLEGGWHV